jgi:hypothetical protein
MAVQTGATADGGRAGLVQLTHFIMRDKLPGCDRL